MSVTLSGGSKRPLVVQYLEVAESSQWWSMASIQDNALKQ